MDAEELMKTVCQNLRSVTQSCKGGVPLNRLAFDYNILVGNHIPHKILGYDSLESFIWNIPDVVRIKMINGQRVVEGVVDETTAHIASLISRQKNSKSGVGLKNPVPRTVKRGNENQIPIPSSSSDSVKVVNPNPKMEELKKAVLINLRGVAMSCKEGVLLQKLQGDYRALIGTHIPFNTLGYDSLEKFIQSIPDVIKLKKNNVGQLVAEAVPDASTAHIFNLIKRQKQPKKNGKTVLPWRANMPAQKNKSPKPKSVQVPQKYKSQKPKSVQVSQKSKVQSLKSSVDNLSVTSQSSSSSKYISSRSFSSQATSKQNGQISKTIPDKLGSTTKDGNSVVWRDKTLGSFPCIKDNITNAHFSTLLGLHNLLYGISYMDILKERILKFGGYLFREDSEEWKKREFLFSVLPADGLNEYLNLLCVEHCDTEGKHALLSKLLSFIAYLRAEMIDPKIKMNKLADSDLYKQCHEKDKQILEVVQENKSLKAELQKMKISEVKSSQTSKKSELQSDEVNEAYDNIIIDQSIEITNLKSEVNKLKTELTVAKEKGKAKGKIECDLNTLRNESKIFKQTMEKQKTEFVKYVNTTSSKMEKQNISHATEVKAIKHKLSSYESIFNLVENQTTILKNEIGSRPSHYTTITLPLINKLLEILNEVHLKTQPQTSLSSA